MTDDKDMRGSATDVAFGRRQFMSEPDFCADCGAILPLPDERDFVTCLVCKLKVNVEEFDGLEIHSEIIFCGSVDRRSTIASNVKREVPDGPLVDRRCPKCNHEGMTYATLQTRSADEGQTVFYTCPKCRFKEIENS